MCQVGEGGRGIQMLVTSERLMRLGIDQGGATEGRDGDALKRKKAAQGKDNSREHRAVVVFGKSALQPHVE